METEFVRDEINFDLVSKKVESSVRFIDIPFSSLVNKEESLTSVTEDTLLIEQAKCALVNSDSYYDLERDKALLQMLQGWNYYQNPNSYEKEAVLRRSYK